MKEKNNIVLLVIGVATLLVAIVGAAYAYFSSSITPGSGLNLDVEAQANTAQFTASGGQFGFTVTGAEMQESQAGSIAKEATGSINVSLSALRNAICTFDVAFEWDSGSSYTATSGRGSQFEFGVLYSGDSFSATNNAASPVNFDKLLSTYNGIVLDNAKITVLANGTSKTTNITLNFKVQMYNLNHDQSALAGTSSKTYNGKFYVDNIDCVDNATIESSQTLSDTVLALERTQDYISSQDGTIYRVVNQNGVRYEGKDPDNYVYYNCSNDADVSTCERWRIIGVFDGADIGLTSGKKYTKIARSTPLEDTMGMADGDEYDWENSYINAYLNGTYLNSLSQTAQRMIANENNTYSMWHLLGPDSDKWASLYSQDWYLYERDSNYGKPGYRNGVQYGASAYIKAALGVIYPSDWGYAAYGEVCDNEIITLNKYNEYVNDEEACTEVNWLSLDFDGNVDSERLISPISDEFDGVFLADRQNVRTEVMDSGENAVRPVLYLGAGVSIDGGKGTYNEPYILSLD